MKSSLATIFKFVFIFSILSSTSYAQISLISEDFNDCSFPVGWGLNIIGDGTPFYEVGMPTNDDSDGSSIDGSCMLIIDDDAAGNNTPPYVVQFLTPTFNGLPFSTIELNLDVHWRPYQGSTLKLKVFDGTNYHEVRSWGDGEGTGEQFSEFENVTIDLSFYASPTMQLVIEYDDNGIYAWWAGVDNIEITGFVNGTNVVLENFNDCALPTDWTTDIQQGDNDWQFGLIDNSNANTNSMDGTCFAYFDDDGLGQNAAFSSSLLISEEFAGSDFANYTLEFDLIFRKFADLEQFAIWVWDGTEAKLVETFTQDVAGPQFNNYEHVQLDLSTFRSPTMRVVFSYFDGNAWGWWVGIDNVKITGEGQINDLCENAFDLNTGETCITGSNLTAIFEGDQPTCIDNTIAGLWYRYQADFTGILKINTAANFNDVVTVFTGGCVAPSEVTCTNRDEFGFTGEALYMDVTSGTEYLVRVSGIEETFGVARGQLCITAEEVPAYPDTPVNDDCTSAIPLNVGSSCITGNNLNANFNGPEPTLNLKSRADIWYTFEASTVDEIEILTEADFSDVITIYSGTCGALVEVASNEFGRTLKTSGLTIGETYYVQVAAYFATLEGAICISVREVNALVASNDLCINATELVVGGGCVEGQNISAGFDGPTPSCTVYADANIWYQFIAPPSGGVKINTGAEFVHSVAVYSGDCDDLTEFLCLNNPTRCEGYFEIGGLIVGETYYMQIASAANPFGFLEGGICVDLLDYNSTSNFEPLALSVVVNCVEEGYGMLSIEATGGVGAYTFLGNTTAETLETGDEYLVVLSDENGCETSRSGIVECGMVPCFLNTNTSVLNITCFGEDNGQIFVEVLDGTPLYTYEWSNGATSSLINGLSAGSYSVTVTDINGCRSSLDFDIQEPAFLIANISAVGESDSDLNDGSASATPSGGTSPFSYVWSNGETTQSIENLEPGIYTVTVTDANDCEIVESIIVSDFDCALSLDVVVGEITCYEANDGFVEIYPLGGMTPYTFAWSNGATTDIVSNLAPGTYTVTVTDANNCPWIENVSFIEPTDLSLSATEVISADCNGSNTGSATVAAQGGTAPYVFTWPNGNEGEIQMNLSADVYFVTVTDFNGCTEVNAIEILEPAVVAPMSINTQHISCFGEADGVGTVIVSGGTPPYSYQWNDPNASVTSQVANLGEGTYNVEVTDFNGCTGTTTVNIIEPAILGITIDEVFNDINNTSVGAVNVTPSGGTPPYTFGWYDDGTVVSSIEDPTGLSSGTYVLVVMDANGCSIISEEVTIDNIVGVSDPELEQQVELLPNPTSGKFQMNVELSNTSKVKVLITDIVGRVLIETKEEDVLTKTFNFDLSEYPAAVYPVKVFIGDKMVLKQVIIQK